MYGKKKLILEKKNQSCCWTLYAFIIEKDNLKHTNIIVIGWSGENFGKWLSDYGMESADISNYEEESTDQNKEIDIDTIWSKIQLSKKWIFKYIEQQKVKYIGIKPV